MTLDRVGLLCRTLRQLKADDDLLSLPLEGVGQLGVDLAFADGAGLGRGRHGGKLVVGC